MSEPSSNEPVVETPASPPVSPPAAPPAPTHSQAILHLAGQYGIPPHVAATFSKEELRGEIADRQLLARDRAIRANVNPAPTPAASAPEPDFDLPPELASELDELNPAVKKALQAVGRAAVDRAERDFAVGAGGLDAPLELEKRQSGIGAFAHSR
jgi:hypothetical protein